MRRVNLLTTADVADYLRVGEDWVREHARDLGGIRLGRSARAPLRFDQRTVDAWLDSQRLPPPVTARRRASSVRLLPLR